jgi:peptidoglycan/LPS O-acetylase OafA/YrhL
MVANIQTLRFFAASWVVLLHMQPFSIPGMPKSIVQLGFVGVDLFFVISGAIMAITTNDKRQTTILLLILLNRDSREFIAGGGPIFSYT